MKPITSASIEENSADILIVEDEVDVLEVMTHALTRKGFHVTGVDDPMEALLCLRSEQFDLIICDMHMPQMNGIEFYQELEKSNKELLPRLIFTTGDTYSSNYQNFFKFTQVTVLPKPFGLPLLFSTVQHKLEILNSE